MFNRRRVRKGMAIMDMVLPGWENHINTDRLDINDGVACVLGQTVGWTNFRYSSRDRGVGWFIGHGFISPGSGRTLTQAWIDEITKRRIAAIENDLTSVKETV